MMKRKLLIDEKDFLALLESEPLYTLYFLAEQLQAVLLEKIHFEKNISFEELEGKEWTLGHILKKCEDLLSNEENNLLSDFKELRNKIVHGRGLMNEILINRKIKNEFDKMLKNVFKFVNNMEVVYESSQKLEDDYAKYFKRRQQWLYDFFKLK